MGSGTSAMTRKKLLQQELERFVHVLVEHNAPEMIIAFGSLATGQVHAWSDIDLVVVVQTDLPFLQRSRQLRNLLRPKVGTDILVYTPQEFAQMRQERPFFRDEILTKGIVLYERTS